MIAILSDIHGNLEALQAVLGDIKAQGINDVYCLGDLVNYGPNPRECIDLVRDFRVALMGNHDRALLLDGGWEGVAFERMCRWTKQVLDAPDPARELRWEFLRGLPTVHREEGLLFVHGSPRNPLNEYVFPEDIYNQPKLDGIFALIERYCFHGHTHIPGIIIEVQPRELHPFYTPEEMDYMYKLDSRKALCNVGSVGQPRDGDWRASYVVLDGDTLYYRRVEYDIDATAKKIHDDPDMNDFHGDRRRDGH